MIQAKEEIRENTDEIHSLEILYAWDWKRMYEEGYEEKCYLRN